MPRYPDYCANELQHSWLHVWECLDYIAKEPTGAIELAKGNTTTAIELWNSLGESLGFTAVSIKRNLVEARSKQIETLTGCSWTKCPRFRDDRLESQLNFLQCSRCKTVRALSFDLDHLQNEFQVQYCGSFCQKTY